MKKTVLTILLLLGAVLTCHADSWSDLLKAYKMDTSTLVRGNGYQIFKSEAGGLGIAYSEIDAAGECHFSLAMVPIRVSSMRWLPGSGASFLEVKDPFGSIPCLGVLGLQEVEGPATDPKLGSFTYVIEPTIHLGYAGDRRILNLAFYGDKTIILVKIGDNVLWVDEKGQTVDVPTIDTPSEESPAQTLLIEDTRAVDIGLSVFWADRNVGADTPQAYGEYFSFGTPVPWGGTWRTPSAAELNELLNKCSWELTACEGVNGYRVTGPNGNSIFLPLGGSIWSDGTLDRPGECGSILSCERPSGQYFIDNGFFFHLQMTDSDNEVYRHYLRFYTFGDEKTNLRPVMPKP